MNARPASIILLAFLACLPFSNYAGQDLQSRFEASLKNARAITNVEIEFLDTLSIQDPAGLKVLKVNKPVFSRTSQYSFIASGQSYRAVDKLVSGTETNLSELSESVFDSKSYSTYHGNTRSMTKNSLNAPAEGLNPNNPLLAPFSFLGKSFDGHRLDILRFTDITSNGFAKGFSLPAGQKTNGLLEISIPGHPVMGQPTSWRVTIDEVGDSFTPKSIEHIFPARKIEVISRLLNYTNLGTYQFPSRIEWAETSYPPTSPPTLHSSGTVTLISARIPDQLADSVFELKGEEESADSIWDWSENNFVRVAAGYQPTNACAPYLGPVIYKEFSDVSKQIADALGTAGKERKRVLLQFGANWSDPCRKLHELFQTNEKIADELKKNYLLVMVDVNNGHNADIDMKYGHPMHFGIPANVILDSDGKLLTTEKAGELAEGEHYSPEKILAFLNKWSPTK